MCHGSKANRLEAAQAIQSHHETHILGWIVNFRTSVCDDDAEQHNPVCISAFLSGLDGAEYSGSNEVHHEKGE